MGWDTPGPAPTRSMLPSIAPTTPTPRAAGTSQAARGPLSINIVHLLRLWREGRCLGVPSPERDNGSSPQSWTMTATLPAPTCVLLAWLLRPAWITPPAFPPPALVATTVLPEAELAT